MRTISSSAPALDSLPRLGLTSSRQRARTKALALGVLACGLLSGCVADLRPGPLRRRDRAEEEACGRGVLDAAAQRQHAEGAAPWSTLPAVGVRFSDSYFGLVGLLACPWPTDPATVDLAFVPGTDISTATFQSGEGRETWGIHGWNAWSQQGQGEVSYDDHARTEFWLPTLQYFCELPFRLAGAEIVDCGGRTTIQIEGIEKEVDQVYVTWGRYAPHPRNDQYLAFVDTQTGFLVRADFTVRDLAGFAKGRVLYRDPIGNFIEEPKVPTNQGITSLHSVSAGVLLIGQQTVMLHELVIEAWTLEGVTVSQPDPSRPKRPKP